MSGAITNSLVQEVEVSIPRNRKVNIEVELPEGFPNGDAVATVIFNPAKVRPHVNRAGELLGKGKGKIWMAEDFDAPLEDFAEYM